MNRLASAYVIALLISVIATSVALMYLDSNNVSLKNENERLKQTIIDSAEKLNKAIKGCETTGPSGEKRPALVKQKWIKYDGELITGEYLTGDKDEVVVNPECPNCHKYFVLRIGKPPEKTVEKNSPERTGTSRTITATDTDGIVIVGAGAIGIGPHYMGENWGDNSKCQYCVKEGKTSTVRIGSSSRTCAGISQFYDKDGKYHIHDGNITSTEYICSNNHEWTGKSKSKCWCETGGTPGIIQEKKE